MTRRLPFLALLGVPPLLGNTATMAEVKVDTRAIQDFEFDWGRDGGGGFAGHDEGGQFRLAHTDGAGRTWIAQLDPETGDFLPEWRVAEREPELVGVCLPSETVTRRRVPGSTRLILTAPAPADAAGLVHRQVFLFDPRSGSLEQLTFDPVDKDGAVMWPAPEFGGESLFFTVAGGRRLDIYRRAPAGKTPAWSVLNAIVMPEATPFVGSPGHFVHNGSSWIYFWLSAYPQAAAALSRIAITGIDPAQPTLRALTPITDPPRSRRHPQHFVTAQGPFIYYTRTLPATATIPAFGEGIYRVDTGLGPCQP